MGVGSLFHCVDPGEQAQDLRWMASAILPQSHLAGPLGGVLLGPSNHSTTRRLFCTLLVNLTVQRGHLELEPAPELRVQMAHLWFIQQFVVSRRLDRADPSQEEHLENTERGGRQPLCAELDQRTLEKPAVQVPEFPVGSESENANKSLPCSKGRESENPNSSEFVRLWKFFYKNLIERSMNISLLVLGLFWFIEWYLQPRLGVSLQKTITMKTNQIIWKLDKTELLAICFS